MKNTEMKEVLSMNKYVNFSSVRKCMCVMGKKKKKITLNI